MKATELHKSATLFNFSSQDGSNYWICGLKLNNSNRFSPAALYCYAVCWSICLLVLKQFGNFDPFQTCALQRPQGGAKGSHNTPSTDSNQSFRWLVFFNFQYQKYKQQEKTFTSRRPTLVSHQNWPSDPHISLDVALWYPQVGQVCHPALHLLFSVSVPAPVKWDPQICDYAPSQDN